MKKKLFFLLILSIYKVTAQNKQVLYNFAELPQSLLLNPAAETNYKFHIGVPLLSGFEVRRLKRSELGSEAQREVVVPVPALAPVPVVITGLHLTSVMCCTAMCWELKMWIT